MSKTEQETSVQPRHIALVMDGNGRWAQKRKLPRTAGHKEGVKTVERVTEAAIKHNIPYITLFGFSSENWQRPEEEVSVLMGLLKYYLENELSKLNKNGVRIRFVGDLERLGDELIALINKAEESTKDNEKLNLTIALSYGSRQEIISACQKIAQDYKDSKISLSDIDVTRFSSSLYTEDIPDPDLLIRTSGELRISNFLLWQLAYSELYFTDTLWPDFSEEDFLKAINEYKNRDRRYGKVKK